MRLSIQVETRECAENYFSISNEFAMMLLQRSRILRPNFCCKQLIEKKHDVAGGQSIARLKHTRNSNSEIAKNNLDDLFQNKFAFGKKWTNNFFLKIQE